MRKSWSSQKVLKKLRSEGFYILPQKATDHVQLRHPNKPNKVTVPHPRKDLDIKILKSIEKQSGIKFD